MYNQKQIICKIKNNKNKNINIIVARYNEDLKWTLENPFNKFKYIIYNKSDNDNFEKTNVIKIVNLPNIGREFHTYMYHIIENYDNLADINVFFPGSLEINIKKKLAIKILNQILKYNEAIFITPFIPYVNKLFYNYKFDTYTNTSKFNDNKNKITIYKSSIRPFGKWYKKYYNNNFSFISQFGIFSVNKYDIIQHSKIRYMNILNQLSLNINPEVGFYVEISIYSLFYPYKNTIIEIYYYTLFSWLIKILPTLHLLIKKLI
jgi:hypothetical protein